MPDETLQPTHQKDAPVVIDRRPQEVVVDDHSLDTTPQVVDGRVKVSDDISAQAVEQGYEPDNQPRAAVPAVAMQSGVGDSGAAGLGAAGILPDTTAGQVQGLRLAGKDAEADAIIEKSAATKAAFDVLTAPLSVKSEAGAQAVIDAGAAVVTPEGTVPAPVSAADLATQSQPAPSSAPDITHAGEPQPPDAPVSDPTVPDPPASV